MSLPHPDGPGKVGRSDLELMAVMTVADINECELCGTRITSKDSTYPSLVGADKRSVPGMGMST